LGLIVGGFGSGKRAGLGAFKFLKRPVRFGGCLVSQRGMRPDVVVVVAPEGQFAADICQAVEDLLIEAFVAQAAIERFDVAILLRLSGVDVMPLDAVRGGSLQDRLAGELGAVATDYAGGFSIDPDESVQLSRDSGARDAGVGNQAKVFTATIVVHGKDTELPAGPEGVRQKVQRPALVRAQWDRHRCSTATSPFAATTTAHRKTLFPVNPVKLLFVHHHAHTFQHDTNAPTAKPTPLLGDLVHFQTDIRVIGQMLAPHGRGIDTDQDAGPALRDWMPPHRPQHRVPPLHRCRQGFPSRSFRTTLSSITSATRRFSLAFSSSSCFSRLASDQSIPPYLAFSL
jgi:hypothetical protein